MLGEFFDQKNQLATLTPLSSATGGSAMKAVEVLFENGVPEERIIFVNLVMAEQMVMDQCFC
jgi:uracil phosphoribosyltransferase